MERDLEKDNLVYLPYFEGDTSQNNNSWVIKGATVIEPVNEEGQLCVELNQTLKIIRRLDADEVFTAEEAANVMNNAEPPLDWECVDLSEPKSQAVQLLREAVTAREARVS